MFQILDTIDQASEDYKTFSNEDCCNILSEQNQNIINDNGLNKIYYLDGKGDLHQEFYMKDGKKNGLYTDYYPSKIMDGKIVRKQVVNFKNDLEEGMYTQYSDGLKHAEWKMYEIEYKNGLKHGLYKKYGAFINCSLFNNGEQFVQVEDNYKNGKKHGLCTLYLNSQPGVIANKEEYKDGGKISESDMHEASIIPGTPTKSNIKKNNDEEAESIRGDETPEELVDKIESKKTNESKGACFAFIKIMVGPPWEYSSDKWNNFCSALKEEDSEFCQYLKEKDLFKHPHWDKEESGGCFIATATMGDYNHPIVRDLRDFRDQLLLNNIFGKIFVKTYYFFSPTIASLISKSELTKSLSLKLLIQPLHELVKKFLENKKLKNL
jgi:antitoxin component YwqK of YwqJK toxin-antitoxin module